MKFEAAAVNLKEESQYVERHSINKEKSKLHGLPPADSAGSDLISAAAPTQEESVRRPHPHKRMRTTITIIPLLVSLL